MKFRLTPLNIITALGLAFFVVSLFQANPAGRQINMSGFYKFLLGALVVVSFISDMIFRFTLKDTKRIWIIETLFVFLTIVLVLILQK